MNSDRIYELGKYSILIARRGLVWRWVVTDATSYSQFTSRRCVTRCWAISRAISHIDKQERHLRMDVSQLSRSLRS